jgi:hypothetical protein
MNTGTCRGCGQPILWVEMADSGRANPLNPEHDPRGNIVLDRAGKAHYLKRGEAYLVPPIERYVSHFATCSRAKEFRKP